MTRYRLEHAVVMDTDDIPGRGGYAVVGISRGASQAERLFVAQNFGISDFLHDPQNDRTFYSFFRVPGGRRAFVRRFANGRRRNGTQNRLFVHTLFFEDELFDAVAALPWLVLEGNVRAEGSADDWQPLRNDVPWVGDDGTLPALELELDDAVAHDVPRRLSARLALAAKEIPNANAAVAAIISALRDQPRAALPQGRGYEWLTLIAWSMLPRRDRDELAWTQHDTHSGIAFQLANAVKPVESLALDRPVAPIAAHLVARNLESPAAWRELQESSARYGLSIRRSDELEACLAHRDAVRDVAEHLAAPEQELLAKLTALAATGKRLRGRPCFEGEGILTILWNNIPRAVAAQQPASIAIARWASLLHRSGLDEVVFRDAPDRRWLDRAAADVGADLVVDFFLRCTENLRDVASVRRAVAEWLVGSDVRGVEPERLARLVVRAYGDRTNARRALLGLLLANAGGLATLQQAMPVKDELAELAFDASLLALDAHDEHAPRFVREVLVPQLELSSALAAKITGELAERIAPLLRDDPTSFQRFYARLGSDVRVHLVELVASWLRANAQHTLPLAREVLQQLVRDPAATTTGSFPGLLLLLRPVWTPRLVAIVETFLGRSYSGVAGWSEVVIALASDFADSQRAAVSKLVASFWQKVQPEDVASLPPQMIDALSFVDAGARRTIADVWRARIRRLPDGDASERLLGLLFGTAEADDDAPFAWRELEQGLGSESTLNRLDVALHRQLGGKYAAEMASAIAKYAGDGRVARVRKLGALLHSPRVLPTVKRIIEATVLPQALQSLHENDWRDLAVQALDEELLCRGPAMLTIAHALGANGDAETQQRFERTCRAHRRDDAVQSLAAGRRSRSVFARWLS